MKGIAASLAVATALAMAWTAPAQAGCASMGGNFASVVQDGSTFSARATVAQTLSTSGSACIDQDGSNATAYVKQEGGGAGSNTAEITQIGGDGQGVYVRQQGNSNRVTVTQSQADGATSLGAQSLLSPGTQSVVANTHPPTPYSAIVFQSGDGGTATIEQRSGADGSYAEINQATNLSTAGITQDDTLTAAIVGNFASIIQKFSGNSGDTATITQNGDNNYASLAQNGSNLTGSINQTYNGNTAALTQTGNGLNYAITQNGASTVAGGITYSGVTDVSVSQSASGSSVTLH